MRNADRVMKMPPKMPTNTDATDPSAQLAVGFYDCTQKKPS